MKPDYTSYRFYRPQKRLMYLAAWPPDAISDKSLKRICYMYIFVCQSLGLLIISSQIYDLYLSLWDLRKMTFNFCSSTIIIGILGKMSLLVSKREKLRSLHYNLWKDSLKYKKAEDEELLNVAFKKLILIMKIMFAGPYTIIPIWATASYFSYKWGPRILPFAGYYGVDDYSSDAIYLPILIYQVIAAFFAVLTVLESDLSMLALVLQVEAHCKILSKNLIQLIQSFAEYESWLAENKYKGEVNKYLKRENFIKELSKLVKRHSELLSYCDDIEYVFNGCMVIQLLGGSFVILMNGIETIRHATGLNIILCYQMLYLSFLIADVYIICYHFTTLATEFTKIGQAVYDSCWYRTDSRVKKMLGLILTRAQKPPRFTYGKLFKIDMNAFMHLIKNIYSWLMLLRQLEMKQ